MHNGSYFMSSQGSMRAEDQPDAQTIELHDIDTQADKQELLDNHLSGTSEASSSAV